MLNRRFSLTRRPYTKALRLLFIAALLTGVLGIAPAKPIQAYPVPLAGAVSPGGWRALPNKGLDGLYRPVSALALSGDDLYVGGRFPSLGDGSLTDLGGIARYNTTTGTWHALPNQGLSGSVIALAVSGDDLYVGGSFHQTGDGALTDLGCIARYDITAGTWHALPNRGLGGEYDIVSALAVSGDDLYVGGISPKPAMGH